MRMWKPMAALAALALGITTAATAQVPELREYAEFRDSATSIDDSTERFLILSDAIVAREMGNMLTRNIQLAELGARQASTESVRDYARDLVDEYRDYLVDLNRAVAELERTPTTRDIGLGSGISAEMKAKLASRDTMNRGREGAMAGQPRNAGDSVVGFVAYYWQDTVPVFRQNNQGQYVRDSTAMYRRDTTRADEFQRMNRDGRFNQVPRGEFTRDTSPAYRQQGNQYTRDTLALYRMETTVVVPVTAGVQQLTADTVQLESGHRAAMDSLQKMSGADFERSWLERQIQVADRQADRLRDDILPLVFNDDMKMIAQDMQTTVGVQERRAMELKDRLKND